MMRALALSIVAALILIFVAMYFISAGRHVCVIGSVESGFTNCEVQQ